VEKMKTIKMYENEKIEVVVYNSIELSTPKSYWKRGVREYALELLDNDWITLEGKTSKEIEKHLLNGASDWNSYSYDGCSLIFNSDIAERLCTPSELKSRNGGDWNPTRDTTWLDVQARALYQAYWLIIQTLKAIER
jgi:hypothetical protein